MTDLVGGPEMKADQILNGAADYIERHGWTQGAFWGLGNEACALGACFAAAELDPDSDRLPDDVMQALQYVTDDHVADWNDETGRTQDEVIAALRDAAELVRETT